MPARDKDNGVRQGNRAAMLHDLLPRRLFHSSPTENYDDGEI